MKELAAEVCKLQVTWSDRNTVDMQLRGANLLGSEMGTAVR